MASADPEVTPIVLQAPYIEGLNEAIGCDFYRKYREQDNMAMLNGLSDIEKAVSASDNSFAKILRAVAFGNMLDPSSRNDKSVDEILADEKDSIFLIDDSRVLREKLLAAENIFYVTDNAGEIVVDRLFISFLRENKYIKEDCKVTVCVRGFPAHNDAMRSDAVQVGLDKIAEIIDSGTSGGYAGLHLEDCSQEAVNAYAKCDLVISKGMGNYETLEARDDKTICFLLVAKCVPIAEHLNVPQGSSVCLVKN